METDSSTDRYLLERGWTESVRLDYQHHVLKNRFGWTLHPRLTKKIQLHVSQSKSDSSPASTLYVADLATGTGIAALELASEYQSSTSNLSIAALDISDDQFPHPATVPPNVTFGLCDLFKPPPAEYQAAFDIIHVRLLAAALIQGDQDIVAKNLFTMLKPGGYVQWVENYPPFWGPINLQTLQQDGELARFHELTEPYCHLFQKFDWVKQGMGELMEKAGFEEVQSERPPPKREVLQDESLLLLWVAKNASQIRKKVVPQELHAEQDECIAELEKGVVERKILLSYYLNVVTAKKPMYNTFMQRAYEEHAQSIHPSEFTKSDDQESDVDVFFETKPSTDSKHNHESEC